MAILIGHRGARSLAPENTLLGIRTARRCGADYVEVDVRLSRDGHLVLMHDETVDRTTDGSGRVEDLILEELRRLNAGGEPVPTLEEAVAQARSLGLGIVVEMKEEWIENLVVEAVKGERALVTSFYHGSLREAKELGEVRTGIIISSLPINPVDLATQAGADAIFPKRVNANLFKRAHHEGIKVYPWTVNDSYGASWLLKLGADGLVTDDPCLLKVTVDQPLKDTTKENCDYYPCHFQGQECTHCFCPLYPCKDPELGRFVRTRRGKRVWTCIDCELVHRPRPARYLTEHPDATTEELKALESEEEAPMNQLNRP